LALKGRRFDDIITIQKQSQATLAKFKTQDFANVLNNGMNARLNMSSCKETTLKGTAWNSR
jgi:hypothetical protein